MNKLLGVLLLALLAGCSTPVITDCVSSDDLTVYCGYQNPEDLALSPDGKSLIVSQFGSMQNALPGNLALSDFAGNHRVVFSGGESLDTSEGWGDSTCTTSPSVDFSPHGIDLSQRPDGRWQLLVINHGQRESVEFFEVDTNLPNPLIWRGCVEAYGDLYLNDVVGLNNGGFWASNMYPKGSTVAMITSMFGRENGFVVQWQPEKSLTQMAGTQGSFPNGIEKSSDDKYLYINHYTANQVLKFNVESATVVKRATVQAPDNLTWDSDGKHLLVASHTGSLVDMGACQSLVEKTSCPVAFKIIRLDISDMSQQTVFHHQGGAPMGAATVALPVNDFLYLGTFAGDRLGRVAYPQQ